MCARKKHLLRFSVFLALFLSYCATTAIKAAWSVRALDGPRLPRITRALGAKIHERLSARLVLHASGTYARGKACGPDSRRISRDHARTESAKIHGATARARAVHRDGHRGAELLIFTPYAARRRIPPPQSSGAGRLLARANSSAEGGWKAQTIRRIRVFDTRHIHVRCWRPFRRYSIYINILYVCTHV